jgi:hypothetical protein
MTKLHAGVDRRRLAALAIVAAALLLSSSALATSSYYIDECTNYSNGTMCDIANVNTITASLQSQLSADGWSGSRFTEYSAWPQDFWESCSTSYGTLGDDSFYGDTKTLSVFAGHGAAHLLAFSSIGNGGTFNGASTCQTDMTRNMRLGTMSGSLATFGMWLVCEAIQGAEMGSNMWQSLRQQAGWQNSISIGDNEPRDFYNATSSKTNANAWLDQMSSGGRNAIIATFSSYSATDCWNVHNAAKLKGNVYNFPRNNGAGCQGGQPGYYYCYQWRQN